MTQVCSGPQHSPRLPWQRVKLGNMSSSAKVGLLVIVFVTLLISGLSVMGKSFSRDKTDTYYGVFADATGVRPGAKITMAGVVVGTVESVQLDGATRAKAKLNMNLNLRIPAGSSILISAPLIGVGESALTVVVPEVSVTSFLQVGANIPGAKASPVDNLLPGVKDTIKELNKTLIAVRGLVEDEKLRSGLTAMLSTTGKTLEKFGRLADRVELTLSQSQGDINQIIKSASAVVSDVRTSTKAIASMVADGKFKSEFEAILSKAKGLEERADQLMVSIDKLVNDPKLRDPLAKTVANFEKISESGTRIAANTEKIVQDGTVISSNAVAITEKAKVIADKAIELEDQLKALLQKADGIAKKGADLGIKKVTTQFDLMRQTNPGYWRTDVNFSIPMSGGTLNAGLWDAFNTNKINLQLGKELNSNLAYRVGIFASKPSFGVDYRLAPRMTLRGDVWDINKPRFDLRARYEFGNGLFGWFGFDRMFERTTPTFGVGIKR